MALKNTLFKQPKTPEKHKVTPRSGSERLLSAECGLVKARLAQGLLRRLGKLRAFCLGLSGLTKGLGLRLLVKGFGV